jgi:hypothetical protein
MNNQNKGPQVESFNSAGAHIDSPMEMQSENTRLSWTLSLPDKLAEQ